MKINWIICLNKNVGAGFGKAVRIYNKRKEEPGEPGRGTLILDLVQEMGVCNGETYWWIIQRIGME